VNRRQFLRSGLVGASAVLGAFGTGARVSGSAGAAAVRQRRAVLPAGRLPYPALAPGTDTLPQIEHFVVLMMENHSFDNILGLIGRGDGFAVGANGRPKATNPDGNGHLVHAFHMPTECQTNGVSNDWKAAHVAYAGGSCQGFVEGSSPEAMGYFTAQDLPFSCAMARVFPIADRYFCSAPAQSDPNKRYLFAGTSLGQIDDKLNTALPPNGTIYHQLNAHGISWKEYYSNVPSIGVFLPLLGQAAFTSNLAHVDRFFADAAAGTLPAVSVVEPDYDKTSEENPQDVQFGDQFVAKVVNAVMASPNWHTTMLIWTYDEHGGYYDHVPPPAAIPPDDIAPSLAPGDPPGAFDRYGFRVPCAVVSPYAKRHYVSHTVYDHTSILKTIETKWNLPALTRRDANAHSLLDMVDLHARPAFSKPPKLPAPPDPAAKSGCLQSGAGTIPPPSAVTKARV
jgi:phospholipase C